MPIETSAEDGIPIDESTFPDDFFRSYVAENFDLDGSETLSSEEILAVKKISFPNYTSYHTMPLCESLEGIQIFTELEYLDCSGNKLSGEVDLSGLSKLVYLDCCSNYNEDKGLYISSLYLAGDTSLQELYCYNNILTELELSDCASSLTVLNCENNILTELDVSDCTNLITLYCGVNALTTLDVSGLSKLNWLSCNDGGLDELILGDNDSMTVLKCDGNNLTELDLRACPNLKTLTTEGYQLYGLDVSGLKDLQTLDCSYNNLGSLDLSNNPELYHLECDGTGLTELDITNNPEITNLDCSCNSLTELDLNSQETIRTINLSGQELSVTAFASDDKLAVSLEGLVKPENIENVTPDNPDVTLEGNCLIIPDAAADEVVYNYETKFGDMDVHLYIEDTVEINPDISSCAVMLSPESFVYDGTGHLPEITVMDGERILTEGIDYTVAYPENMDNTNAGDIEFSIIGKGFYTGEKDCTFTIKAAEIEDMTGVTIELSEDSYTYDGEAKTPAVTVMLADGTTLEEGTDYTVDYKGNTKAGTATVIVEFMGNYSGTETLSFTIEAVETETETNTDTGTESEVEAETEAETETENISALKADAVKTGDTTPAAFLAWLVVSSGFCFALLLLQRRKHDQER